MLENRKVRTEYAGYWDEVYEDDDHGYPITITVRIYEYDDYDAVTGEWLGTWHDYDLV